MNLFFYLQTFILNYSFIVILSDHIFLLCFIKTQPSVKRKPVKTEKKNTGTIAFRFRQVLLYLFLSSLSFSRTPLFASILSSTTKHRKLFLLIYCALFHHLPSYTRHFPFGPYLPCTYPLYSPPDLHTSSIFFVFHLLLHTLVVSITSPFDFASHIHVSACIHISFPTDTHKRIRTCVP